MILLDTHAWVWLGSDPARLSRRARRAIQEALSDRGLMVSSISAWEVALLAKRGRLELSMDVAEWVDLWEDLSFVRFVPVDNAIAVRSVHLPPEFPDDPADRIIAATALVTGVPLVTADKRLRGCPKLRVIW